MKTRWTATLSALCLASTFSVARPAAAQGGLEDGLAVTGSVLLSVLHLPIKLTTCIGTQALTAVAYTATYGVAGNYEGGTNGREIGEVARRACAGAWIIPPEQVKRDYQ
ncbi:MAG TPA: hypothetical protein VNO43_00500 [Candidatus Eisenbacteria bacterium]|nr:hypothetical protein [Candidatus Eisenbacteria bacterium]